MKSNYTLDHSWQRGPNPLFYEDPSILSTARFSNFVQPPYPATTNHHPIALPVVLFYWLNRWLCQIWCAILLTDIMNLYMSSLVTLVPEGPWCVVYATRHHVYWGLTSLNFLLILWFDITLTNTHRNTNIYITCCVLTAAIFVTLNE